MQFFFFGGGGGGGGNRGIVGGGGWGGEQTGVLWEMRMRKWRISFNIRRIEDWQI